MADLMVGGQTWTSIVICVSEASKTREETSASFVEVLQFHCQYHDIAVIGECNGLHCLGGVEFERVAINVPGTILCCARRCDAVG